MCYMGTAREDWGVSGITRLPNSIELPDLGPSGQRAYGQIVLHQKIMSEWLP